MLNNNEIWKQVEGFENFYSISNLGNLLSHYSGKKISGENHWSGYKRVNLINKITNQKKRTTIHRLVAETFLINPNPLTHTEVDHIDRNKSNNCVSNLEWVTKSQNLKRRNTKPGKNKPIRIRVVKQHATKINKNIIKDYNSISAACNDLKLNPKSVKMCIDGQFSQTNGYKIFKLN